MDRQRAPHFALRYSIKPARKPGLFSASRYAWGIKGELSFSDHDMILRRSDNGAQRSIPGDQIFDIAVADQTLSFDVHTEHGEVERVVLSLRSIEDMRGIVELMPVRMTPEFAAARVALNTFKDRLAAVTPSTWVTHTLISLNVLVFLAMAVTGAGLLRVNTLSALAWGSNLAGFTLDGEPWRLLTAAFVHFGLMHLFSNMIVLYALGRTTERLYGNLRFLALYVFAGLTGSIGSLLAHPALNSAGASGAIFGVAGGLLVFVLRFGRELPPSIAARNRTAMWAFILFNLYGGLHQHAATGQVIDNAAHVGGLLGGMLIGVLLARPLDMQARAQHSRRSAIVSWVAACVTLAALSYPLLHFSAEKREEIAFSRVLADVSAAQRTARADQLEFSHMRLRSQLERDALSNRLIVEAVPQWDALHAAVENTKLPAGSPREPFRQALLRYLDDNRQLDRSVALILSHTKDVDAETLAPIRALISDAHVQADLMKKLGPKLYAEQNAVPVL
ncbi:rhomboid family intramembrane serine protease [Paraburkholderia sp. GAS199]|uniref:rhomboid family intramembrane serine protease n=1 Tax=Paraburkholderia sp. GAS199 TaxID=3035126 RepID=UPI003D1B4BE0